MVAKKAKKETIVGKMLGSAKAKLASHIKAKAAPSKKPSATQKRLVVFYSYQGNCRFIGLAMAKAIGADVLELKLKHDKLPKKFAEYKWGGYQVYQAEMPDLLPFTHDPKDYDLIIIGTPVWAFTFSPPFRTFINNAKLRGKRIGLFCCHEGGIGKTFPDMEDQLQKNNILSRIDFIKPLAHNKEASRKLAVAWAKELIKRE